MKPDRLVPERVAGYPTSLRRYRTGSFDVELVAVRDLEEVVDRERALIDDDYHPPYWALVWAGAEAVAGRLARSDLGRRTVLDAGCGLGLVALTCALAGGRVTAIDRDPAAIEFLRVSAARLGLPIELVIGDVRELCRKRCFDDIVAAELLYERDEMVAMAGALGAGLALGGRLHVADAGRVPTRAFYDELDRIGLVLVADEKVRMAEDQGAVITIRLPVLARL